MHRSRSLWLSLLLLVAAEVRAEEPPDLPEETPAEPEAPAEPEEAPVTQEAPAAPEAPADGPACDGATLRIPQRGGDSLVLALPAPCLSSATDGDRTAVALGSAGAMLVDHRDPDHPELSSFPTLGSVVRVELDGRALVLHEALSVTRIVTFGKGGAEAGPAVLDAPVLAPEPIAPEAAVGTVVSVRGRWARVQPTVPLEELAPEQLLTLRPPPGSTSSSGLRAARPRPDRIVPVQGTQDGFAVLRLGRGDVVRPGDQVLTGGPVRRPTANLFGPRPWRNQLGIEIQAAVGISVNSWSRGANGVGRARVWYAAPFPLRVELSTEHVPIARVPGGKLFTGADVQGLAELDLIPIGVGVSVGYQWLNLENTGLTVGALLRGGARDGLHFEMRARFLPSAVNPFGGAEGHGFIPFTEGLGLLLEGGGGSQLGHARIGVRLHLAGQGGPGSVMLSPTLGLAVVNWYGLSDPAQPFSGTFSSHVGPSFALKVELRPF